MLRVVGAAVCVVALSWRRDRGELLLIANRDEVYARPTAPLDRLDEAPGLLGGRDLEKGGGWLWARADGRLAAVTNVRQRPFSPAPRSRGELVARFASGTSSTVEALEELTATAHEVGPFHVLLFDGEVLGHATNTPTVRTRELPPGITVVSNGPFDEPWVKAQRLSAALEGYLDSAQARHGDLTPLFAALADESPVPDEHLPNTGVGLAAERMLAPPFIRAATYGTRSSSVVVLDDRELVFAERRFAENGVPSGESLLRLARAR